MGRQRIPKWFLAVLACALFCAVLVPAMAVADPVDPGWARYDDTLPDLVYSAGVPTWDTAVNAGSYNGASRQTLGADPTLPYVTFKFRGSGVKWIARTGVTRGIGKVTLDGVDQPLIDLYAPAPGFFQVPVFVSGALDPNAVHTMTITMTNTRGLGSNNSITVDAVDLPTAGRLLSPTATYNITSSASSGGSVSPAGVTAVNDGYDQAYSFTPLSGYRVKDVLVDSSSVGAPSSYTFTNVSAPHTIAVTFELVPLVNTAAASPWSLALLAVLGIGVVAVGLFARSRLGA